MIVATLSEEGDPMNVSAIFPSGTLDHANNAQKANQQRQSEFQELTQALQSGNLTNARVLNQGALNSAIQSTPLTQGLNVLGSALQSGNLSSARDAYSAVQQDLRNSPPIAAHHHRAHHGRGASQVLTSGFPGGADNSDIPGSSQEAFQPVNLTV
jgi:hypothetical protein